MPQLGVDQNFSVGVAGAGRVAQALGRALRSLGMPIDSVASRDPEHAQSAARFIGGGAVPVSYRELASRASHIVIAVTDNAIESVAEEIARGSGAVCVALHTSGNYGAELLDALNRLGISCGSMHPLQTISDGVQGAAALRNIAFSISGDPAALAWAESIVEGLQGLVLRVKPDSRHLYHAAAVMASNYTATLIDAARELMELAGIADDTAVSALAPLIRTSVENCIALGPIRALTGPVVRGDAMTVAAHVAALERADPSARQLYSAAGLRALRMARERGLGEDAAALVHRALLGEKHTANP